MRYIILLFCVLLGTPQVVPLRDSRASVADVFDLFENIVEHEAQEFLTKTANLLKNVEDGIIQVKDLLPKIHKKVHEDANRVLEDIKDIAQDLMDFISKETGGVYYGFGILDDITDVAGGFKLSTALRVLQLAGSAQKVFQDAKEFEPRLQKKLDKIEGIIEKHVSDLASQLFNEIGSGQVQKGFQKGILDFLEQIDEKFTALVVDLITRIQDSIECVKKLVPKVYTKIHEDADKVLEEVRELLKKFQGIESNGDVYHGMGDLDDIASFLGGFKLSTAIKILKLADSAHKVVQDAKEIQPKLEKELGKIQNILEKHVHDIAAHLIDQFNLGENAIQTSVLKNIEDLVEEIEDEFYKLVVKLLKQLETGIKSVKEMVPQVKEEADKVLNEIKTVIADIQNHLFKEPQAVYFGFGIFDDLTDIAGGFKLSTAIRVLQLVESARKVCTDAKEFQPRMEKEIGKIEGIFEKHVGDLATHIFDEFGVNKGTSQKGAVRDLDGWYKEINNYFYKLAMTLLEQTKKSLQRIKELIPEVNEKIHEDANRILKEVKEIYKDLEDSLFTENEDVLHGLGIFDDITSVVGGVKLSTAIRVLQLAESAHKVCQDAKDFEPKFEIEFGKIQGILEKHVSALATHLVNELGLESNKPQKSIVKDIAKLLEDAEEKIDATVATLFKDIEKAFDTLEKDLPEVYNVIKGQVKEVREDIRDILAEIINIPQFGTLYGFLDIAGTFTKGTTIGRVIRIVLVVEKFNAVIVDVRGFGPHAEVLLQHSIDKVAKSAEDFFIRAADIVLHQ